jgi:hypothetical protein
VWRGNDALQSALDHAALMLRQSVRAADPEVVLRLGFVVDAVDSLDAMHG